MPDSKAFWDWELCSGPAYIIFHRLSFDCDRRLYAAEQILWMRSRAFFHRARAHTHADSRCSPGYGRTMQNSPVRSSRCGREAGEYAHGPIRSNLDRLTALLSFVRWVLLPLQPLLLFQLFVWCVRMNTLGCIQALIHGCRCN